MLHLMRWANCSSVNLCWAGGVKFGKYARLKSVLWIWRICLVMLRWWMYFPQMLHFRRVANWAGVNICNWTLWSSGCLIRLCLARLFLCINFPHVSHFSWVLRFTVFIRNWKKNNKKVLHQVKHLLSYNNRLVLKRMHHFRIQNCNEANSSLYKTQLNAF